MCFALTIRCDVYASAKQCSSTIYGNEIVVDEGEELGLVDSADWRRVNSSADYLNIEKKTRYKLFSLTNIERQEIILLIFIRW